MSWHLAETKEQARREAVHGLQHWHNDYNVAVLGRPGAVRVDDAWELLDQVTATGGMPRGRPSSERRTTSSPRSSRSKGRRVGSASCSGSRTIGRTVRRRCRSWDMVARYVIPAVNGLSPSAERVRRVRRREPDRADGRRSRAVLSKIMSHEGAAQAMATTMAQMAEQQQARQAREHVSARCGHPRRRGGPVRGGPVRGGTVVSPRSNRLMAGEGHALLDPAKLAANSFKLRDAARAATAAPCSSCPDSPRPTRAPCRCARTSAA